MADTNEQRDNEQRDDESIDTDKHAIVEGTTHQPPPEHYDDGNTGADNARNPVNGDPAAAGEVSMDEAAGGA